MNCHQCEQPLPAGAKFCPACDTAVAQGRILRVSIPEQICRRAEKFAGRLWVLNEVVDWMDKGSERFLLITGEPGCGKTALAAWLAGAGSIPIEDGPRSNLERVRDAWKAVHFCLAEGRHGSLNPSRFAQSLARQLSDRYDKYAQAVIQRVAPQIKINQQARENWGSIIGAQIDTLIINAQAEEVYNRAVRDPLEELFKHQPGLRVFILVDALDEALTFGLGNIVTLLAGSEDLPAGVRFLLTSRNEPKVTDQFRQIRRLNLSSQEKSREADADIRAYVQQRMAEEGLKKIVAAAGASEEVVNSVVKQAAGNFLYVEFLLEEVANGQRSLTSLEGLPAGLYGLYRTFLDRIMPEMLQPGGSRRWLEQCQPLLGCVSVAVPAAPRSVLHDWVGCREGEINALLSELIQVTEYDPEQGGGYRLYHRSMADFLAAATYEENGSPVNNRYYTPPVEQHARIIDYYVTTYQNNWAGCDPYGLRRLVTHMRASLDLEQTPEKKRKRIKELYSVVLNEEFRSAQLKQLKDPRATLADCRTAMNFALEGDDIIPALGCVGAYCDSIRGATVARAVFAAVKSNNFDLALKQAEVYEAVPDWSCVLLLYLAWEAAEASKMEIIERMVSTAERLPLVQARALCDALLVRVACTLAKIDGSLNDAKSWLVKLGRGKDADALLTRHNVVQTVAPGAVQQVENDLDHCLHYLEETIEEGRTEGAAEYDAEDDQKYANKLRDSLVKLAADPVGQDAIDRALNLVVINPYPRYRDILLIALGTAALSVPSSSWVRERLQRILTTGLDQEGITFTFDLPSILLAEAERRRLTAQELSEYLNQARNTSDRWGTAARVKSAHAAVLFSQGDKDAALQELIAADQLNIGMAGFATLTLLSFADRCIEFGHRELITSPLWGRDKKISLLDGAMGMAETVRDSKFRQERIRLVDAYRTWLRFPTLDTITNSFVRDFIPNLVELFLTPGSSIVRGALRLVQYLPTVLSTLIDRDTRLAFYAHISARSSSPPERPDWIPLKLLVPMVLGNATTLDAILGRIFRLRVSALSDDEVKEAISICSKSLTTGRPWEFGRWR